MDAIARTPFSRDTQERPMEPAASDTDDLLLVRASRDGEAEAERRLFERLRRAARVVSARNRELGSPLAADEVDDLVQETLVALWRKLDAYDGRVRLETWASGFALLELLRRLRGNRRFAELLARARAQTAPDDPEAPEFDELERVHEELDGLDPDDAQLLRLRYFEERPFESIAREWGQAASTLKARCYRALERLRARLGAGTSRSDRGPEANR